MITVNRERLIHAIGTVLPVVPTRTPKEILRNLLVVPGNGTLRITATNLEAEASVEIDANTNGEAKFLLPAREAAAFIAQDHGETISIAVEPVRLTIAGAAARVTMPTEAADVFPQFDIACEPAFSIPGTALKLAVSRTAFTCEGDSARYALHCIQVEYRDGRVTFVACDGNRLAVQVVPTENSGAGSFLFPSAHAVHAARAFADCDSVSVSVIESWCVLATSGQTLRIRRGDGRFPDTKRLQAFKRSSGGTIYAAALLSAVKQVAAVSSETYDAVVATLTTESITLTTEQADPRQAVVSVPVENGSGEQCTVQIRRRYLIESLVSATADNLYLCVAQLGNRPVASVILDSADGMRHMIMGQSRE